MKIAKLIHMHEPLVELANTTLPADVSYKVTKVLKQIADVIESASANHIALYSALGELNDDETMMIIPECNRAEFDTANIDIVSRDVTIDLCGLTVNMLGDIKPATLLAIEPLFDE